MNELKNDEIYLSKYSGWYSVSDEAFYSDDEIEDFEGNKQAIVSKSKVEWVDEESYFFRLSKWENHYLIIMTIILILYHHYLEKGSHALC